MARHKVPKYQAPEHPASDLVAPHLTKYNGRYDEKYRGLPAEIRLMVWKLIAPPTRLEIKEACTYSKPTIYYRRGSYYRPETVSVVRCKFIDPPDLKLLHLDRTIRAETLSLHKFRIDLEDLQRFEIQNFFFKLPAEISHLVSAVSIGHRMLTMVLQDERVRRIQDLQTIHVNMSHIYLHLFGQEVRSFIRKLHKADTGTAEERDSRSKTVVIHGTPREVPHEQQADFESKVSSCAALAGYDSTIGHKHWPKSKRLRYRISLSRSDLASQSTEGALISGQKGIDA